jgi:hypothetical protein
MKKDEFEPLQEVSGFDSAPNVQVSADPYDALTYTGDIRKDYPNEISAILAGMKARKKMEDERFDLACNPEFWFCVVFQSMEQKNVFLRAMKWDLISDKYIDGKALAKFQGVTLPTSESNFQGEKNYRRLVDEVGILTEEGSNEEKIIEVIEGI